MSVNTAAVILTGRTEVLGENLSHCYSVHCKWRVYWSGIEHEHARRQPNYQPTA